MFSVRTDLAVEANEMCKKENKGEVDGILVEEDSIDGVKVTTVRVINEEGAKKIGKPQGNYITIDMPEFTHYDGGLMDDVSKVLGEALKNIIKVPHTETALVVGLGNWNVTPDALGPKVIEKTMITRHLKKVMPDAIDDSVRPVCGIAPGVLGTTGVETGEVIRALVEKIKPSLVICIDALASRRLERVNKTIQIGDTGISPGAGVGNHRMKINEETLGVPVIAIGVPTVVDAATIANDTIDLVLDEMVANADKGKEFYNMLVSIDKSQKQAMIKSILNPFIGDLMVTPKEVDVVIESVAKIIANGVNIALQPNLDVEDINKFMN